MTKMIDKLQKEGMVTRVNLHGDRRVNMIKIITGVEPLNRTRGTLARVYLNGGEVYFDTNVPHVYSSKRVSPAEAEFIRDAYERHYEDNPEVQVEIKLSGEYRSVVHVTGPRELKIKDGKFRSPGIDEYLRWQFPVFYYLKVPGDSTGYLGVVPREDIRVSGPASLEHLLALERMSVDIEADPPPKYERINTIALVGEEKLVHSIFDKGIETPRRLMEWSIPYLREAVFINSHNAGYDLLKPRFNIGGFNISADGEEPKIKALTGFLKKPHVFGKQIIDSLSFAQGRLCLLDNTLDSVGEYLVQHHKSGSSSAVEELCQRAEAGDEAANQELKDYCLADCELHNEIMSQILPTVLITALCYETNTSSATYTSKSNNARTLRNRRYFERLNAVRYDRTKEMGKFNLRREKQRFFESLDYGFNIQRGTFRDVAVIFPTFLHKILSPIIEADPTMSKLPGYIREAKYPFNFILAQELDAFCEEPLFDYQQVLGGSMDANFFKLRYGMHPKEITDSFAQYQQNLRKALKKNQAEIINVSRFLFIHSLNPSSLTEDLSDEISAGISSIMISASRGRVLANLEDSLFAEGIDLSGKKGLKTDFQRTFLKDFSRIYLVEQDMLGAFNYVHDRCRQLADNCVLKEDLVFKICLRREPKHYTENAHRTERFRAAVDLGYLKDEARFYGYGTTSLGESRKFDIEEFMLDYVTPHIPMYLNKFFGTRTQSGGRRLEEQFMGDTLFSTAPLGGVNKKTMEQFLEGAGPSPGDITKLVRKATRKQLQDRRTRLLTANSQQSTLF